MFRDRRRAGKRVARVLAMILLVPGPVAHAGSFAELWRFGGASLGDGQEPYSDLLRDPAGNLYGTTLGGGSSPYSGTVFEITPEGTETVLYRFCSQKNCADGQDPYAGLIADTAGNLYGTTAGGGASGIGANGFGTVFRLAPDGTETVLHSFDPYVGDGANPVAGLTMDAKGNFYGTTSYGGTSSCRGGEIRCGTVYKLASDGTESVLYSFAGGSDGWAPGGKVVMDKSGNLYGTTIWGGGNFTYCDGSDYGCGTVFRVAPNGKETVLYAFSGLADGAYPEAGLVLDKSGNLYGTAALGGARGDGNVFRLAPDGTMTVLYSFTGGNDGAGPDGPLLVDKAGNLYGTTSAGGASASCHMRHHVVTGCGTVFRLAPDGTETVLHVFSRKRGAHPVGGLIEDNSGHLYGTTEAGGPGSYCDGTNQIGCGTVFRLEQ